jgi:DNA invertase Pin-like site-specific DNA recombinase
MKRRAALYARVAGWDRAVDSQIAQLRDFARKRGGDVAEFIDTDVSIDAERRRPAFDALREAVRGGAVDVVVCTSTDRLVATPRSSWPFCTSSRRTR